MTQAKGRSNYPKLKSVSAESKSKTHPPRLSQNPGNRPGQIARGIECETTFANASGILIVDLPALPETSTVRLRGFRRRFVYYHTVTMAQPVHLLPPQIASQLSLEK